MLGIVGDQLDQLGPTAMTFLVAQRRDHDPLFRPAGLDLDDES